MQPIPTIGILVFRNNNQEVLLVKHGEKAGHLTDSYGLPAGRIDPGENDVEASIRELKEETGLKTSPEFLIELPYDFGVVELKRKKGIMLCTWKVFICTKYRGEIGTDGKETTPEWVNIKDVAKYWLIGNTELAIKEGLKLLGS